MPIASFVWPWILVSALVHGIVFFLTWGVIGAGMMRTGHGVAEGDGFGGTSVDLEIAGPTDSPPVGAMPPTAAFPDPATAGSSAEPTPEPTPAAESTDGDLAVALPTEPRVERPRRADPREGDDEENRPPVPSVGASEVDDLGASASAEPAAPGEAEQPGGSGGDDSTAGVQAGDPAALILSSAGLGGDAVTARRALLPSGGVCTDPVAGTWQAQKYRASDRTWVRFTLSVRRQGANLTGSITSRIWTGRPSDPRPGPCTAFGMDHTWRMSAHGRIDGDDMVFGSSSARLVRQDCPRSDHSYAPDRFGGTVHPLREVFDAVNNDGAFDIDEPYTFRRISCE